MQERTKGLQNLSKKIVFQNLSDGPIWAENSLWPGIVNVTHAAILTQTRPSSLASSHFVSASFRLRIVPDQQGCQRNEIKSISYQGYFCSLIHPIPSGTLPRTFPSRRSLSIPKLTRAFQECIPSSSKIKIIYLFQSFYSKHWPRDRKVCHFTARNSGSIDFLL